VPVLYLINATSLAKAHAVSLLASDMKESNADVGLVAESWFTSKISDNDVAIPGFNLFRRDRFKRKGGGVCIYIRDSFDCTRYHTSDKFEVIWLRICHCHVHYFVACCYHPPRSQYDPALFVLELCKTIDDIVDHEASPVIVVTGDFNQLCLDCLEHDYGLAQIVTVSTHGDNILDKVYTNRPDVFSAKVHKSLIKTKHMAVVAAPDFYLDHLTQYSRIAVNVFDQREHHIDKLRYVIANIDWSSVTMESEISVMYSLFVSQLSGTIHAHLPMNVVRLGPRDPPFITPLIKHLLRKRNRLRRRGKRVDADSLAEKINALIIAERSRSMDKLANATPKQLWQAVGRRTKVNCANATSHPLLNNVDAVNDYFASISFSDNSKPCPPVHDLVDESLSDLVVHSYEIEPILSKIKPTAPGLDGLPSWLFNKCSVELATIVAHIFTRSLSEGIVPNQWKCSLVTPVPKVAKPCQLSDFRPISVTPILSRVLEKMIVKRWLFPSIPPAAIKDQFAFKPTGSTTCALVYFMHHVTKLLETNSYVRCLLVDFSKAFDVVDHGILFTKLQQLNLPSPILSWLSSFLTGRTQQVKSGHQISAPRPINRGIVQGSGVGPMLFVVLESDLNLISVINLIFKYADDNNLIVPQFTDVELATEFEQILTWAKDNCMILNLNKTKEIVFYRPSARQSLPSSLTGIEQVATAKLLGITFSQTLSFDEHARTILSICSQRMYLLKCLKSQGLPARELSTVFNAIVVSRFLYAIPAWGGFLSAFWIAKIDALLSKCVRYGYIDQAKMRSFLELVAKADKKLFASIVHPGHCLNYILPPSKNLTVRLRNTHCLFTLPLCHYNLFKKSFVIRNLFDMAY